MLVKYWIHEPKDIINMNAQLDCLRRNGFIIKSKEYNELTYISSISGRRVQECNVEITNVCEEEKEIELYSPYYNCMS